MSRSKWKGPYIEKNLNQKVLRKTDVVPNYLDKTIPVYNGRSFTEIKISNEMLGKKLGEFSFTRAKFVFKKKKSKK